MTTLGTVQTKYSKKWIYLNPTPLEGPSAWNVANIPSETGEAEVYGIPPIMVSQTVDSFDLSYSIIDCKSIDEINRQLRISEPPSTSIALSEVNDIDSVVAVLPVATNKFDTETIIYFNIGDLPSVDTATTGVEDVSGYNSDSIASITAEIPLEVTAAGPVATVSFDMTTLPDA